MINFADRVSARPFRQSEFLSLFYLGDWAPPTRFCNSSAAQPGCLVLVLALLRLINGFGSLSADSYQPRGSFRLDLEGLCEPQDFIFTEHQESRL